MKCLLLLSVAQDFSSSFGFQFPSFGNGAQNLLKCSNISGMCIILSVSFSGQKDTLKSDSPKRIITSVNTKVIHRQNAIVITKQVCYYEFVTVTTNSFYRYISFVFYSTAVFHQLFHYFRSILFLCLTCPFFSSFLFFILSFLGKFLRFFFRTFFISSCQRWDGS